MQRNVLNGCQPGKTIMTNKLMLLVLLVVAIASGCKKHNGHGCLQVKVLRITCASTVFQSINDNSVGEDGWTNITDHTKYDNVFNVSNSCKLTAGFKAGDILYVTVGKPVDIDCIRCALYDAAPATGYDVTSLATVPCGETAK